MTGAAVDELGEHGGQDHVGLRVGDPDDVALPDRAARGHRAVLAATRAVGRPPGRAPGTPCAAGRPRRRGRRGTPRRRSLSTWKTAIDSCTTTPRPEGDQDHDRQQAEGVADDARECDAAAVGERPADHEDHAGAGDDDEDQGREAEGEDLVEREHVATLVVDRDRPVARLAGRFRDPFCVHRRASRHRRPQARSAAGVGVGAAGERPRHDDLHPRRHPDPDRPHPRGRAGRRPARARLRARGVGRDVDLRCAEHPFHARLDLPRRRARPPGGGRGARRPCGAARGPAACSSSSTPTTPSARRSCATSSGARVHRRGHRRGRRAAQRRPALVRGPAGRRPSAPSRPARPTTCRATSSPPRRSPRGGSPAPRAPSWPRPSRPTSTAARPSARPRGARAARPAAEGRLGARDRRPLGGGPRPTRPGDLGPAAGGAARAAVRDAVLRRGRPRARPERQLPALVGAGQGRAGRPGGARGVGAGLPRVAGRRRCAGLVRPRAGRRGRPALRLADGVAEALEQALPPQLWERR